MKYAALTYSSNNIGDDIQTIAAMRMFPRVDLLLDRDRLDEYESSEKTALVMNGWFSGRPEAWPPSPAILPIFVGFHMTKDAATAYAAHRTYFTEHAPIGCRDRGTAAQFAAWQVPAFVSYCLTLSLPRRERSPSAGRVAIVETDEIFIPASLRRGATTLQLSHLTPPISPKTRLAYAQELLDFYRNEVSLVITTRLHCALPCLAMGIPVIFFGKRSDNRISIVKDVGGRIYSKKLHRRKLKGLPGRIVDPVDWSPSIVDLGAVPSNLELAVKSRLEAFG